MRRTLTPDRATASGQAYRITHHLLLPLRLEPVGTPCPAHPIPASIPRSDVFVCDVPASPVLRTLPLSPFMMYRDQHLLMHFFGSPEPPEPAISPIVAARYTRAHTETAPKPPDPIGWPAAGLGWRRWVSGEMLGYRNSQWQEVEVSSPCIPRD